MLRRDVELPSFEGVAAGQVATLNVPANGTYYQIDLEYRESGTLVTLANMKAAIEEVRLLINGKIVRRHSAEDLIDILAHYERPYSDGYLHLFFWEPWADNVLSQEIFTWGMSDVRSFTIEVKVAAGRTAPTLKAVCKKTLERKPLGLIRKISKFSVAVGGTGITNYQTLPVSDSYKAIHCRSTNIADAEVIVNGSQVFKATKEQVAAKLKSIPRVEPVTGYYHIDFDDTIRLEDFLPMTNYVLADGQIRADGVISDFQLNFNMSSATGFTLLTETIGYVTA